MWTPGAPVVPIVFYRALLQSADLGPVNRLTREDSCSWRGLKSCRVPPRAPLGRRGPRSRLPTRRALGSAGREAPETAEKKRSLLVGLLNGSVLHRESQEMSFFPIVQPFLEYFECFSVAMTIK